MNKIFNNNYWLNHVIKEIGISEEVQNYQVRYKFYKNTEILKYLVVKVKFLEGCVKMKIYNKNLGSCLNEI